MLHWLIELVFSLLGLPGPLNNDFKKSVNSWFSFVPMLQIGKSLGTRLIHGHALKWMGLGCCIRGVV